ncbi:hypothetical protein GCM10022254_63690 [Actinomadura meridiana]|uniref:Translation initiation factor 2 n=1 Tax=Actinomadura meridiana TaxID=559626 RepID=A0ABP8CJP9_9ACTN
MFAARSAIALNRLLDVLPVFAGDDRVERLFTLIPGSEFHVEALTSIERAHARMIPWDRARERSFDLIVASSPKGMFRLLRGRRVLLPHGAAFSKTIPGEGSEGSASGLDPVYLLHNGRAVAAFHGLAHPDQVRHLNSVAPRAAERAAVVGDPTLERLLASRTHRDRYRSSLGTGARSLVVMASTWGPESLLQRRPRLPADLATRLPHDAYQLALVLHPNARSEIGGFDLAQRLAPALDAGLVLGEPYEEWAALLIAADAVITDHGSTALYAAALDRPIIGVYDGGDELIPGSPMAELLDRAPRLEVEGDLQAAIRGHVPGSGPRLAESVFAEQGRALELLRQELYELLGLTPPAIQVTARVLPAPSPPVRAPVAFAARTYINGFQVRVERRPAHGDAPAHHLAAEFGVAGERLIQSAGLLYRRAEHSPESVYGLAWTVEAWLADVLENFPGCRTAAVIMSPSLSLTRRRGGPILTVSIGPCREDGRIMRTDPAAILSAVHAWLSSHPDPPAAITCEIGPYSFPVRISPATAEEAARVL